MTERRPHWDDDLIEAAGMPDEHWLVIRPLRWNAFTEELTFCSPQCAANYLHDTFAPPAGLLP